MSRQQQPKYPCTNTTRPFQSKTDQHFTSKINLKWFWDQIAKSKNEINIKSIGSFSADKNINYSSSISEFMKKTLGIDPTHCIIHFVNLDPENVGCSGTTMKELMKK
ncbi:Macrophage migration inhibitory factor (MIF) family protein [Acanthocheilonema viteae]